MRHRYWWEASAAGIYRGGIKWTRAPDTRKWTRPSFTGAAAPERAEPLVAAVAEALRAEGVRVGTGEFGARLEVELVNDGPVTIVLEVDARGTRAQRG